MNSGENEDNGHIYSIYEKRNVGCDEKYSNSHTR